MLKRLIESRTFAVIQVLILVAIGCAVVIWVLDRTQVLQSVQ